jgi:hypothetical protein
MESQARAACGEEVMTAMRSLGLLRAAKKDAGLVVCPVWVYPVEGFVVATDRRDDPDGEPYEPPTDVVFPAIYGGTLRFLRLLPEAGGGEALDLCGGSGIGALWFSRTARAAATADVTGRSAHFAEFNARLNGAQVSSLCGDLYAPVAGRQFDVISAHPPFVPAVGPNMVYRDGGDTGEEITRRVIEGVPGHLRKGGTCMIVCVARDTLEKPFEQRARDWLGASAGEFDIVFGLEKVLSVEDVVDSMRNRGQEIGAERGRELLNRLRSLGTRQFVYGALFMRRLSSAESPEPFRIRLSPDGGAKDFARLLAWRQHSRRPGLAAWLQQSRPRLASKLELTVRHVMENGELTPAEFVFAIDNGFVGALRLDGWAVPLVARLDGRQSVGEVHEKAGKADELPEGFTLAAFADLVRVMIERGFLEVEVPQ